MTEKTFLMIPGPTDAGDKRPQYELSESVSDNCSIILPIGQLVWEKMQFVKDASLKKMFQIRGGL